MVALALSFRACLDHSARIWMLYPISPSRVALSAFLSRFEGQHGLNWSVAQTALGFGPMIQDLVSLGVIER